MFTCILNSHYTITVITVLYKATIYSRCATLYIATVYSHHHSSYHLMEDSGTILHLRSCKYVDTYAYMYVQVAIYLSFRPSGKALVDQVLIFKIDSRASVQ